MYSWQSWRAKSGQHPTAVTVRCIIYYGQYRSIAILNYYVVNLSEDTFSRQNVKCAYYIMFGLASSFSRVADDDYIRVYYTIYSCVYIYGNNNITVRFCAHYILFTAVYMYTVCSFFFLGNTINIFVQWPPIEIIKYSRETREYRNKYFRMILTGSTLLECKYKMNYLNGSHSYPYFCHCISRG